MPKRVIQTGPDLLSGEHTGVGSTIMGRLFLANRNLLPDPTFTDISPNGGLEGFDGITTPVIRAWNYFVTTGTDYALVGSRLPLSRGAKLFAGSIGTGALAPASNQRPDLTAPPAPKLTPITSGSFGFGVGYCDVAYALVSGALAGPDMRFTAPSSRAQAHITTQGQRIQLVASPNTTGLAPVGIAIYSTPIVADSGDLPDEDLYLQEIYPFELTSGAFTLELLGSWREGEPATANETYEGGYEDLEAPDWFYEVVHGASLGEMNLQLSWSYRTANGWSAAQSITPSVDSIPVAAQNNVGIAVKPPLKPTGALEWRPEWRGLPDVGAAGSWYTYTASFGFDDSAYIYTADPTSGLSTEMTPIDRSLTDASGIPSPTTAPTVSILAAPTTTSGTYKVVATALYDEGVIGTAQSAPSPIATASVATNGALLVEKPAHGNLFPNTEFRERNSAGTPDAWAFATGASLGSSFSGGVATYTDTTDSTSSLDVATLDSATLDPNNPHTLRVKFTLTAQSGGTIKLLLRQLDDASATLVENTLHSTTSGADLALTEFVFGSSGDFTLDSSAETFRLVVRHEDNAGDGRNATWELSQLGLFEGRAAPLKRSGDASGLASDTESPGTPYPASAYAVLVENPATRHSDLNSLTLNSFEYYAPYDTLLESGKPLKGLKLPVRPGETYTISFYAEVKGVENDTALLHSLFANAGGQTIRINEPVATFSGAGARYTAFARYEATLTAPASAAYFEITGSSLGRGRVRIMGLQWEKDTSASAYDIGSLPDDNTGTAVVTFDVGNDTVGPIRNLSDVRGIGSFDLIGHADDGTLGYELRSGAVAPSVAEEDDWSDWVTDPDDLIVDRIQRYVQVRFTLIAD